MDDAFEFYMCDAYEELVQEAMNDSWGEYEHSYDIRGQHDDDHVDTYHYSINRLHPGVTQTSAALADRLRAIAATMLEEALHH